MKKGNGFNLLKFGSRIREVLEVLVLLKDEEKVKVMKEDEGKEVIALRKAGEKVQILFTFPILRFLKKKMKNLKGETIKKNRMVVVEGRKR